MKRKEAQAIPGLYYKGDGRWEGRFYKKGKKPSPLSKYFSEKIYSIEEIAEIYKNMKKAVKLGEFDPWVDEAIIQDEDVNGLLRLKEAVDQYLLLAKQKYAVKTYTTYKGHLDQLVEALSPNRSVDTIKKSELEMFVNGLPSNKGRKVRCASVNNLFEMLSEDGHLSKPVRVKASGGNGVKQKDYLTLQEYNKLENYWLNEHEHRADSSYLLHPDIWFMGMFFGMRISETLNFKPCWISSDLEWISYGDQTWTPKHRDISNVDTLPILDIAKERLAKIIDNKARDENVFQGRGLSYSRIEQYFKRATGGMFPNRYLPYHSLRKSFGMLLVKDYDLHPKRLQEMMRHGDMETTMKFYMSKDMDDLQSALNKKGGKNVVENKNTLTGSDNGNMPKSYLRLVK